MIARLRAWFSFPVLAKELVETAARPRTYALRVIYALGLYAIFALNVPDSVWKSGEHPYSHSQFGAGGYMFDYLLGFQFLGVALFLPALMCGRITQEKERESLVLLFLTELRPWSIVLQKYCGGLVPMMTFLLLGLPLAGVAYAFGGIDTFRLGAGVIGLFLTCLQFGALAMLCSSWCRTTVGAFLATYFLGIVLYLALPLGGNWLFSGSSTIRFCLSCLLPPEAANEFTARPSMGVAILAMIPSVVSTLVFLVLARIFLVRRAFVPPSNFLRRTFERIDGWMKSANRLTGGIVVWRDANALPGDDPIFWRDTQRRMLGQPQYLLRLMCAVLIPTVLLCVLAVFDGSNYAGQADGLSLLAAVLGAFAVLLLAVHAANTLVSERVGQTLEVLLTTPLGAREIVRQKERALRRLQIVVAVPLLTVFAMEAYVEHETRGFRETDGWLPYITCAVLLVAIYMPLFTWLALWIGLRVRTRFQAILNAVAALAAWTLLAPLLFAIEKGDLVGRASPWSIFLLLSPASAAYLNENSLWHRGDLDYGNPWVPIIVNAVFYTGIALFFRWRLFDDAERCLRR